MGDEPGRGAAPRLAIVERNANVCPSSRRHLVRSTAPSGRAAPPARGEQTTATARASRSAHPARLPRAAGGAPAASAPPSARRRRSPARAARRRPRPGVAVDDDLAHVVLAGGDGFSAQQQVAGPASLRADGQLRRRESASSTNRLSERLTRFERAKTLTSIPSDARKTASSVPTRAPVTSASPAIPTPRPRNQTYGTVIAKAASQSESAASSFPP